MAESNRKPYQQYRANGGGKGGFWKHNNNGNRFHHGQGSPDGWLNRYEDDLNRLDHDSVECKSLFEKLVEKLNHRQRQCTKLEAEMRVRFEDMKVEVRTLAEERKRVAELKKAAAAEREQSDRNLEEIRMEREQIERRSTDIAVQLAELKRAQRDLEKRKAKEDAPVSSVLVNVVQAPEVEKEAPSRREVSDVPSAKRMKFLPPEINEKRELVHAALHEDAPGLYELLEERGLLDDMEVITDAWAEDPFSPPEDFKDLTNLISKHWGASSNLLKEGRTRVHTASSSWKPDYCLPCLVSLIEHTRIHKQHKLPVKWGWCRALNAFLFVFEKNNRIVIERPEYGFATYFFELVHALPVKWQVDRLIKVMSCICRGALLENRSLEENTLLPGEATVLADYGLDPRRGVASLLNYCERVHHDYKTKDEAGEWKAKIGRLLWQGLNQGSIVVNMPRKLGGGGCEASSSSAQPPSLLDLCTVKQETHQDATLKYDALRKLVKQEQF